MLKQSFSGKRHRNFFRCIKTRQLPFNILHRLGQLKFFISLQKLNQDNLITHIVKVSTKTSPVLMAHRDESELILRGFGFFLAPSVGVEGVGIGVQSGVVVD